VLSSPTHILGSSSDALVVIRGNHSYTISLVILVPHDLVTLRASGLFI